MFLTLLPHILTTLRNLHQQSQHLPRPRQQRAAQDRCLPGVLRPLITKKTIAGQSLDLEELVNHRRRVRSHIVSCNGSLSCYTGIFAAALTNGRSTPPTRVSDRTSLSIHSGYRIHHATFLRQCCEVVCHCCCFLLLLRCENCENVWCFARVQSFLNSGIRLFGFWHLLTKLARYVLSKALFGEDVSTSVESCYPGFGFVTWFPICERHHLMQR